jgi:DNA end-binding protein Ku
VRTQEVTMATSLMDMMAEEDFSPSELHDDYASALQALIDAKLRGAKPPGEAGDQAGDEGDGDGAPGNVVDLMALLRRSVNQAKAERGAPAESAGKAPPKKTASRAKKTAGPAEKRGGGAAKKTTAKPAAKRAATRRAS